MPRNQSQGRSVPSKPSVIAPGFFPPKVAALLGPGPRKGCRSIAPRGWHISNYRAFACENDADAKVWAEQLVDGHNVELWSGPRWLFD